LKPQVLMLAPEAPYPLRGGGAYRTASLLHYFARLADVDLILMSEGGRPALLPPGLVRTQTVIPLPVHGKGLPERLLRNARRAFAGVPPLVDRLSGLRESILRAIGSNRYDLGIVEHSWCAPYVVELSGVCKQTVLDLHNVESVLHERCGATNGGLVALGHRRFAKASRTLESELFPGYSMILTTSPKDAARVLEIAPAAHTAVYRNTIPWVERPQVPQRPIVAFSGNFEYHPNIDALHFLLHSVWPEIRRRQPELRLRLIGRGSESVRIPGVEASGPVEDALSEIAAAAVVIAPLRIGSGTRIKIVEAWAAGRPVVATPLAAEGLDAVDGRDIILAETAMELSEAVDRLIRNPDEGQRIADNGRLTFESSYTWEAAWRSLAQNPQLMLRHELNRYTV
jgi:glycosyltransferase involved in cell wall biosynthesis